MTSPLDAMRGQLAWRGKLDVKSYVKNYQDKTHLAESSILKGIGDLTSIQGNVLLFHVGVKLTIAKGQTSHLKSKCGMLDHMWTNSNSCKSQIISLSNKENFHEPSQTPMDQIKLRKSSQSTNVAVGSSRVVCWISFDYYYLIFAFLGSMLVIHRTIKDYSLISFQLLNCKITLIS